MKDGENILSLEKVNRKIENKKRIEEKERYIWSGLL